MRRTILTIGVSAVAVLVVGIVLLLVQHELSAEPPCDQDRFWREDYCP